MKILILADTSSVHTIRWANALQKNGFEIAVLGFSNCEHQNFNNRIRVYSTYIPKKVTLKGNGIFSKLVYLKSILKVKRIINDFKPDCLHSYYASSYGLVGALTNFHPFYISVWGSDVFDFPQKSFMTKWILKYVLSKSDKIFSTSNVMAEEIKKYSNKSINVIPFGVELSLFNPVEKVETKMNNNFVIGSTKSLEDIYGIENLIRAFKMLKNNFKDLNIKLLLVGEGTLEKHLKNLCHDLQIENQVEFIGKVPHHDVVTYLHKMDIAVFLSKQESFGVSLLEAMACKIPVIVSKAKGFNEIVENDSNGIFVDSENLMEISNKMSKLIFNERLRFQIGASARKRVEQHYNWDENVTQMINTYKETINVSK